MNRIVPGVAASILFVVLPFAGASAAVYYVDPSAPGVDDGSSWEDAFADLQSALSVAAFGDSVLVAGGLYVPGAFRTDVFSLPNGASVLGSYGGYDAADPYARDPDGHPSILSGEIGAPIRDDNCFHVVLALGTDLETVLDGFVVTRGYSWGGGTERGAGVAADPGSVTLRQLRVVDNVSRGNGGAIYATGGALTMEDVEVSGGASGVSGNGQGGGVNTVNCNVTLTDCAFLDNTANNAGGGMFHHGGTLTATRCVFERNAAERGGGLRIGNGESTLLDCEFRYNTAEDDGGGILNAGGTYHLRIVNGLFWRNYTLGNGSSGSVGGALYLTGFGIGQIDPEITNCTFAENEAGAGGAVYCFSGVAVPRISNCILWGNYGEWSTPEINSGAILSHCIVAGSGGSGAGWNPSFGIDGGGNLDADPGYVFMVLGDLHVGAGSPAIDAGDPAALNLPDHDLDGNPRPLGATVDIGAYEFVPGPVASPWVAETPFRFVVGPNPARGELTASFELPRASEAELFVHDVRGRLVRRLVSGRMEAGGHRVSWDGRGIGGPVAAGVYFLRLRAGEVSESRRVVILR